MGTEWVLVVAIGCVVALIALAIVAGRNNPTW